MARRVKEMQGVSSALCRELVHQGELGHLQERKSLCFLGLCSMSRAQHGLQAVVLMHRHEQLKIRRLYGQ